MRCQIVKWKGIFTLDKLDQPKPDGLVTPKVGSWSRDKHHFLHRYLDAFTTSMKKKKWSGLHYIDLFAGAGIEDVENYGLDWGSPLIAARQRFGFTQLHLCEKAKKKFDALNKRLEPLKFDIAPQIICGNSNEKISEITQEIPKSALSVAFLDPYGLHLDLETIRHLSILNIDLIIFFPDHIDALRNWKIVYQDDLNSNLDRVLGTDNWRDIRKEHPPDKWADELIKLYQRQLQTLGFKHFDYERITQPNGVKLYKLMFCTRVPIALNIWGRIASSKPGGQRSFDFTSD